MLPELLGFVNLFCVGVLAGEEFVIRLGVRAPVASLDEGPQIQLRQSPIRRLRIVVPSIFGLALLSGVAADISRLFAVRLVMKEGIIYRTP